MAEPELDIKSILLHAGIVDGGDGLKEQTLAALAESYDLSSDLDMAHFLHKHHSSLIEKNMVRSVENLRRPFTKDDVFRLEKWARKVIDIEVSREKSFLEDCCLI